MTIYLVFEIYVNTIMRLLLTSDRTVARSMRRLLITVVLVLSVAAFYHLMSGPKTVPKDKTGKIENYLRTVVVDTLEKDYQRHNINITVVVTDLKTDRITKETTPEYSIYAAQGRVSYMIKGKREWRVKEGNLIRLAPEAEITHWFSCEIFEDRYGELYKDKYRNRLEFYAENPSQ